MSLNQTDEEMIFRDEVSDEAVEAAFVAPRGLPTLMHNTYCFACPSLQSVAKLLSKSEALRIARFLPLATKIDQGTSESPLTQGG